MSRRCVFCTADVPEDSGFCPSCGQSQPENNPNLRSGSIPQGTEEPSGSNAHSEGGAYNPYGYMNPVSQLSDSEEEEEEDEYYSDRKRSTGKVDSEIKPNVPELNTYNYNQEEGYRENVNVNNPDVIVDEIPSYQQSTSSGLLNNVNLVSSEPIITVEDSASVNIEEEDSLQSESNRTNFICPCGLRCQKWSIISWCMWIFGWIIFIAQGIAAIYIFKTFVYDDLKKGDLPWFSAGQLGRGVFCIGQFCRGYVCLSQMSFCVIGVGQLAITVCGIGQGGVGILFFVSMLGLSLGISAGAFSPGSCVICGVFTLGCFNYRTIFGWTLVQPFVRCGKKKQNSALQYGPYTTCLRGSNNTSNSSRTRSSITILSSGVSYGT